MNKIFLLLIALLSGCYVYASGEGEVISPGKIWPDDRGVHINAHGGGILFKDGTYYWYGEHKSENTSSALVGITCYTSRDLIHWKYQGVVLPVDAEGSGSDIEKGCIMERPKVIFNTKTNKYVMWFHLELKGHGYDAARTALAVSDKPFGPFKYIRSERPNPGVLPLNMTQEQKQVFDTLDINAYKTWWTPQWRKAIDDGLILKRDLQGGQMARDMQLFVDDDGKAYHIFASEENLTLHIAELSADYQSHTGRYVRVAPCGHNEAPALFKRKGKYWMITSGCTGWAPNEARMFSSDSIFGPWTQHPNPFKGERAEITFGGQSTYVLKVNGLDDSYIFMGDIWRPEHPIDARYLWLPIRFTDNDIPYIEWVDEFAPMPQN